MIADDEKFAGRWSRMKEEARQAEAEPAGPPPAAPDAPVRQDVPAKELPPVESLRGLASEYRDFMQPGVDKDLKRAALKKLFSDPHFEAFDRFEAYCEDFTKGEPIPLAMLKTLEHAKGLLFDDPEKEDPQVAAEKAVAEKLAAEKPAADFPPAAPAETKEKT